MGTIFILVLVQIMNINTTTNNGCTQISVLAGVGKGSSYEIHTIMKMIEQIACYMLKIGHTGMHIEDPRQHVCGQLLLNRSGGVVRLLHHREGGQMQNKALSIIVIVLSTYSIYRLSITISF